MSLNATLRSLLTALVFASVLFTVSCNHKDNEINATCFDEQLNQEEQRVDCGGPNCPPCPPTCDDGVLNQGEEEIDCGGPECEPCGTCDDGIQNSVWDEDTQAFVMEQGIDCGYPCQTPCPPTCDDGIQNGDEEGIDCGGSNCDDCPPPTCSDGVWNGQETGVDCGGPDCPDCPEPSCNDGIQNQNETGIDCGGVCDNECPEATCFDGVQNQGEQGIDCGGPCVTQCLPESCNDGIQNQGEEWIDCGGPCPNVCPTCDDGIQNGPEAGEDCVIGIYPDYFDGNCPQCPTCNDGMLNQDETNVDCGGPFCDDCEMWLDAINLGTGNFVGENFEVQLQGFDLVFSATQSVGDLTRTLRIKVDLNLDEGMSGDVTTYFFSPSVQYTNFNGIVFESIESAGSQMTITFKEEAPEAGPKRIEGTINDVVVENVDIVTGGSVTIETINFGINYE